MEESRRPPAALNDPRLLREQQTVAAMIACYCRGVHGGLGPLCTTCQTLLDYAANRLNRCPFGGQKPVCAQCPIHCYQPRMRETMKQVMRYAGSRLLLRHPVLTVRHWLDARRPPPASGPDQGKGQD